MSVYDLSDVLREEGKSRWWESGRDSGIEEEWGSTRESSWRGDEWWSMSTLRGDIAKNWVSYKPNKFGVSVGSLISVGQEGGGGRLDGVGQCKVSVYILTLFCIFQHSDNIYESR